MVAIDMEMPKSCAECLFMSYSECLLNDEYIIDTAERDNDCPLKEIVTCKDCKHYKIRGEDGYCSKRVNTESHIDVYREPNYFCALGERRE